MTRKELFNALCKEIEGGLTGDDINVSKGLTEDTLTIHLNDNETQVILDFSGDEFFIDVLYIR